MEIRGRIKLFLRMQEVKKEWPIKKSGLKNEEKVMKKRLVVLFIAVVALFVFAGCEDAQPVVLDEPGEVEVNDVGIQNYNLSGKTLVRETFTYIEKEVEVEVTNNTTGGTTTTRTTTKIPEKAQTSTITFAADGSFTSSYTETYLAGADGDYRDTVTTDTTTATTTTTTTTYDNWQDAVITGRTGVTTYTSSAAGTWERISRQEYYGDSITWEYYTLTTSSSNSSTSLDSVWTTDAVVNAGAPGNTDKVTYSAGDTTNYVNATSDDPSKLSDVYFVREDADGNDVVWLFGAEYTVQPQQ